MDDNKQDLDKAKKAGKRHLAAVISDTHGLLRPEIEEKIRECEAVIHAGDIDSLELYEKLKRMKPLFAVRGNADREPWAEELPAALQFSLYGISIAAAHKKKDLPSDCRAALVITGLTVFSSSLIPRQRLRL